MNALRWTRASARRGLSAALSLIVLSAGAPARADVAADCVRESERAQLDRDEGRFLAARSLFRSCARSQCPQVIRKDCAEFANELEPRIPSVVLGARDDRGVDLTRVRVLVDEKPFADELAGRAIQVDPGSHVFRFEAPGRKPVVVTALVREGERNRPIDAVLAPDVVAEATAPAATPAAPSADARATPGRGVPVMTWILGGVAVAGAGTFTALSLLAVDQAKDLERSCAPRCSDAAIEPIETKFTIARIAGGVAIAAAIGAVLFYALDRGAPPRAANGAPGPKITARSSGLLLEF